MTYGVSRVSLLSALLVVGMVASCGRLSFFAADPERRSLEPPELWLARADATPDAAAMRDVVARWQRRLATVDDDEQRRAHDLALGWVHDEACTLAAGYAYHAPRLARAWQEVAALVDDERTCAPLPEQVPASLPSLMTDAMGDRGRLVRALLVAHGLWRDLDAGATALEPGWACLWAQAAPATPAWLADEFGPGHAQLGEHPCPEAARRWPTWFAGLVGLGIDRWRVGLEQIDVPPARRYAGLFAALEREMADRIFSLGLRGDLRGEDLRLQPLVLPVAREDHDLLRRPLPLRLLVVRSDTAGVGWLDHGRWVAASRAYGQIELLMSDPHWWDVVAYDGPNSLAPGALDDGRIPALLDAVDEMEATLDDAPWVPLEARALVSARRWGLVVDAETLAATLQPMVATLLASGAEEVVFFVQEAETGQVAGLPLRVVTEEPLRAHRLQLRADGYTLTWFSPSGSAHVEPLLRARPDRIRRLVALVRGEGPAPLDPALPVVVSLDDPTLDPAIFLPVFVALLYERSAGAALTDDWSWLRAPIRRERGRLVPLHPGGIVWWVPEG